MLHHWTLGLCVTFLVYGHLDKYCFWFLSVWSAKDKAWGLLQASKIHQWLQVKQDCKQSLQFALKSCGMNVKKQATRSMRVPAWIKGSFSLVLLPMLLAACGFSLPLSKKQPILLEKWNNQHDTSMGQRKKFSTESNPWPVHWAGQGCALRKITRSPRPKVPNCEMQGAQYY